jgi:hypothetical protein
MEWGVFWSRFAVLARLLDVAVLVEEALVVWPRVVRHIELRPEVAVVQQGALMVTGERIGHVEVIDVDDVVEVGAASVVAVVRAVRLVDRRKFGARYAIRTWLKMVAGLEEETLHVIRRCVGDSKHCEEITVGKCLALLLARNLIGDVVEVDVDDVVEGDGTGAGSEGTILVWRLTRDEAEQRHEGDDEESVPETHF